MPDSIILDRPGGRELSQILHDVLDEGDRAEEIHGPPSPNPLRGITIETEELGEAAEQALKLTSINPTEHCNQPVRDRLLLLREEWIQIASVAIRQVQNIDSGRTLEWVTKNQTIQL